MEGRAKVTKEVLCEEARFILANVMAEARYGRQNRYDDIRRVCEGAVSIPFAEYVGFLEKSGYLKSFPHLLGCVSCLSGNETEIRAIVEQAGTGKAPERAKRQSEESHGHSPVLATSGADRFRARRAGGRAASVKPGEGERHCSVI